MKPQPLAWLAIATFTAGTAFAQDTPPAPPVPPVPPHNPGAPADHQGPPAPPPGVDAQVGPGGPEHGRRPGDLRHEGGPGRHREGGMLLGVAVEEVPHALGDQLSLPDGFGVLVNFVVPGSAAEAAGVQPDDILKMLNDQTLVNPEQLSTLVRSFPDGQDVALTVIRKGKESKLTVKLKKQALPEGRNHFGPPDREGEGREPFRPGGRPDRLRDGNQAREDMDEDDERSGPPGPPAPPVGDIMRELRPALRQLGQDASQKARDASQKAVDQLQREITILRTREGGGSRNTKLDLEDARIVIRDDKGELELKTDAGKRSLTVKDPQNKVVFNGPVNTPEERKAVPADILPRLEKVEKEEMPAFPEAPAAEETSQVAPATTSTATASEHGTTATGVPLSANSASF